MLSALAIYILKETKRRQVVLVLLTLLLFPILYGLLNIPKVIINDAIGSSDFPKNLGGFAFDQVDYLILLSCLFFALIIGNALVKYTLNISQGRTTEIAIAGLRRKAYHHTMGLPLTKVQNFSSPELIQMMTTEIEPIGSFAGDILALPFRQGGTLFTILLFVFIQDFYMGLAAISLYPIQAYIVPIFQKRINRLIRARYQALQFLSEEIQDSVEGLEEVRSLNLGQRIRDRFDEKSYNLLSIRNQFYRQKYLLKLVNSLIGNFMPFLFYTVGGYFVIQGNLTLGALVSIVAAHKELQAPWMELLDYYQRYNEADHRYRRLLKKIEYKEAKDEAILVPKPHLNLDFAECDFVGHNLYYTHEHSKPLVEATSFRMNPTHKIAVVSPLGQGEGVFIKMLAGLIAPNGGDLFITNDAKSIDPRKLLGHDIMFTGQDSHIFTGTILDNLYLNTDEKYTSFEDLHPLLNAVELEDDLKFIGLNKVIPDLDDKIQKRILMLRKSFKQAVRETYKDGLVEFYEKALFNTHMSLAENMIFGSFNAEKLTTDSPDIVYLLIRVLKAKKLDKAVLDLGYSIAQNLVEMFADLNPAHPLLEQYCLFETSDTSSFKDIIESNPHLTSQQEHKLLGLALRYIPSKHRIIDMPEVILKAIPGLRKKTAAMAPKDILKVLHLYDPKAYHPLLSVWENIFFGRFSFEISDAQQKGAALFKKMTDDTDFEKTLIELGLYYHTGLAGKNLTRTQRQKIGIARALLSKAQLIVFDKTTATIEQKAHHHIQKYLLSKKNKKGLIWLLHRPSLAKDFDMILVFKEGRIAESGTYAELTARDGEYKALLDAEFREGAH